MTWNTAIDPKLAEAIEYERVRQHTDEARRGYLLAGWERARSWSQAGQAPTLDGILELAGLVEPDSKGKLRSTPVTFADGGYAVAPDSVLAGMEQLVRFWPGEGAQVEEVDHWVREFLIVHPFEDGNGRTAWVLLQWLHGAWENPLRLPFYEF